MGEVGNIDPDHHQGKLGVGFSFFRITQLIRECVSPLI